MARAGLSADRVADEAQHLADERGLDAVTLAELATRLGVRTPSLYKHIEGLPSLRATLRERATRELADVLARATAGRSGPDAVRALARAMRDWARRHPGRYAATVTAPAGSGDAPPSDGGPAIRPTGELEAARAASTVVFDVLAGFGLTGTAVVDATRALRAGLHGFISLEALGGFGMPQDVDASFESMVAALVAAFADWSSLPR